MGVDAKGGRFPICPEMSRFVPVLPRLSRFVPVLGPKKGQKRTDADKTGHVRTNWETPHLASTPSKLSLICIALHCINRF